MSNKILSILDDSQIGFLKSFFPNNQFVKLNNIEQVYYEALEGFFLFLVDHKVKMTQKINGIDKFINAYNGHRSFGVQLVTVDGKQECSFIQYVPIRRFSLSEFVASRPWLQTEGFERKYIRLTSPLPIEVTKTNMYSAVIKTFAEDISMKGMRIIGDFAPDDSLRIKSPLIPSAIFEGKVRWNTPWGQLGQIPHAGFEIDHNPASATFKALGNFLREHFIPSLLKSGQLTSF